MQALHTLMRPLSVQEAPAAIVEGMHAILSDRGADIPVALWDGTTSTSTAP